jgi:hypothetical protein
MRRSTLILALVAATTWPALSRPTLAANGGAAVAIWSPGLRQPALPPVAEADSGGLFVYTDYRSGQLELYAQRVDHRGHPMWASGGIPIIAAQDVNGFSGYTSDGAGGVIWCIVKNRGASGDDILMQRLLPNGTLAYTAPGLLVCSANGNQFNPHLVLGNSGSFYVVWQDPRNGSDDIFAQRYTLAGAPQWAANGIQVNLSTYPGGSRMSVASDLQGGVLISWPTSSFPVSMHVQRLNSSGSSLFSATGALFGDGSSAFRSTPAGDGAGGAWVCWTEDVWNGASYNYSVYATHFSSAGVATMTQRGALITGPVSVNVGGVPIRNVTNGCFVYFMTAQPSLYGATLYRQELDTSGNFLRDPSGEPVLDNLLYPFFGDLGNAYAISYTQVVANTGRRTARIQRYSLSGNPQWPGFGVIVGRDEPQILAGGITSADASPGVTVVGLSDTRYATPNDPTNSQVFGQAFDAAGNPLWDDAELPVIQSAKDFPNDQGGALRVGWNASCTDLPGSAVAVGYRVWRALPGSIAERIRGARPAGASKSPEVPFAVDGRIYVEHAESMWENVGTSPAVELPSYALTVSTGQDSMSGANADEMFMVEAYDDSSHHWFSSSLTGHSVDNLPPGVPPNAMGTYSNGSTTLSWGSPGAPDLCCYDVYRGGSPSFVPSDANRIGTTTDQLFIDPTPGGYYFRIAARDIHGNRGASALVIPTGTADVGPTAGPRIWALQVEWNRSDQELALTLDVPQADEGRIELFDIVGRRLWSVPFATTSAATLHASAGRRAGLPSGLVLVRARARSGRELVRRAVIVR